MDSSSFLRNVTYQHRSIFYMLTPSEVGILKQGVHTSPDLSSHAGNVFIGLLLLEMGYREYSRMLHARNSVWFSFHSRIFLYLFFIYKKQLQFSDSIGNLTQSLCLLMCRFSGLYDWFHIPYNYLYDNFRFFDLEVTGVFETWTGWILVLLACDFAYYLNHRYSHEVNFMWGFHQVQLASHGFGFWMNIWFLMSLLAIVVNTTPVNTTVKSRMKCPNTHQLSDYSDTWVFCIICPRRWGSPSYIRW